MRKRLCISLLVALAVASGAFAQTDYSITEAPAPAAGSIPAALAGLLSSPGERLLNAQKQPVSEVWFLKTFPAAGNPSAPPDALYKNLVVGELVGVMHVFNRWDDYRDQRIQAGYYTLRYALIPQDGNHMGVSPYPDFLLLSPASADTHLDQTLKLDDLLKLSRLVAGTGHPAVASLVPVNPAYKKFPSIVPDDEGHVALQVKLTSGSGASGEFSLAMLLVGEISEANGS